MKEPDSQFKRDLLQARKKVFECYKRESRKLARKYPIRFKQFKKDSPHLLETAKRGCKLSVADI